jgi:gliding motility-associated-like protein
LNPQFYVDNENPPYTDPTFTHDGFTIPIPVELNVICGETYHFKFAVADCVDGTLNTAVFIEAGSFVSDDVDVTVATVSGDTTIVEGCTDANFIFTRPAGQIDDTLIVNYQIGGVAIEGDDYNDLPDTVIFLPGEDSVVITLTPFQDGISEGFESVTISVELVNICGDTIVSSGVIYIGDGPIINIDESDTLILCASDSVLIGATATGGYAPYSYEWFDIGGNPIDVGDSIYQGITENGMLDVLVSATDNCDFTSIDTVTITLNQTLSIDTILVGPATCQPDGYVSAMVSGETTTPQQTVYYSWTGSSGQVGPAASVWTDLASGWYYVTVEDAVCITSDSAFVELLNPPIASLVANPISGCGPLAVTFDYSSSENSDSYDITFGDGTGDSSNELGVFSNTYDSPSSSSFIAQLVVWQGMFCKDSTTVQIQIEICGCMDPVAENYNELATIDDGSCIYPIPPDPIVTAPNVFTPNGDTDETNEEFFLETENLSILRLIIFNRWGNVVFDAESTDVLNSNPSWNGKTEKGKEAEEGVYFYKYEAVGLPSVNGIPGVEIQGHGFLHLIR